MKYDTLSFGFVLQREGNFHRSQAGTISTCLWLAPGLTGRWLFAGRCPVSEPYFSCISHSPSLHCHLVTHFFSFLASCILHTLLHALDSVFISPAQL